MNMWRTNDMFVEEHKCLFDMIEVINVAHWNLHSQLNLSHTHIQNRAKKGSRHILVKLFRVSLKHTWHTWKIRFATNLFRFNAIAVRVYSEIWQPLTTSYNIACTINWMEEYIYIRCVFFSFLSVYVLYTWLITNKSIFFSFSRETNSRQILPNQNSFRIKARN